MNIRRLDIHSDVGVFIGKLTAAVVAGVVVAVLLRTFVVASCTVQTNGMAYTLLPGDRVFCNMMARRPEPGRLLVFRHPRHPRLLTVKRCVAVSEQALAITQKQVLVNGKAFEFPATIQPSASSSVPSALSSRDELSSLLIPGQGDTIEVTRLIGLEFDYVLSLMKQESPDSPFTVTASLYVNGVEHSDLVLEGYALVRGAFNELPFDTMSWIDLKRIMLFLERQRPNDHIHVKRQVRRGGELVDRYVVKGNCFFALNDSWDEFNDSRVWGYVSDAHVLGRAGIVYLSWDSSLPWYRFFTAIRWSRIGTVVR